MSTVYRALDRVLERQVAVKLLAEHLSEDEAFVARFRREALAAAKLVHPNVVQVYDSGHDPEAHRHYIVMEYVEGPTVAQILRERGRLPVDEAVDIVVPGLRGARVRAPPRRDPPRREARQPAHQPGRRREARGLRDREGGRGLEDHADRLGARAPPPTSRPSAPAARRRPPAPTCTRSASSCTSCSPGGCRTRPAR